MGAEAEEGGASITSVYATMIASWLTPSCLFILLNLVIGTIAITSRSACQKRRQLDSCGAPSPSLLDRVTSFGLGCCKIKPAATVSESQRSVVDPVQNSDSPRLNRVPSSCETANPAAPDRDPNELGQNQLPCDGLDQVPSCETESPAAPDWNQLPRAPSFLERIVSLNFRRSDSVKSEKGSGPDVTGLMEEEKGVDARAEDFIKSFKQQLRMQRLDSILRYRNMLRRNWEQDKRIKLVHFFLHKLHEVWTDYSEESIDRLLFHCSREQG